MSPLGLNYIGKMKNYVFIASCFGAIVVSGHSSAIAPTFEVEVESPARPIVTGKTNLPDGTKLMVHISRAQSNYSAGTKVKVASGGFRSEQFSQHGSDLNPGTYKVEISMPGAPLQTDAVRAVIGMNGEKLSGPLVRKALSVRWWTMTLLSRLAGDVARLQIKPLDRKKPCTALGGCRNLAGISST
jgi:hypothetical protein